MKTLSLTILATIGFLAIAATDSRADDVGECTFAPNTPHVSIATNVGRSGGLQLMPYDQCIEEYCPSARREAYLAYTMLEEWDLLSSLPDQGACEWHYVHSQDASNGQPDWGTYPDWFYEYGGPDWEYYSSY